MKTRLSIAFPFPPSKSGALYAVHFPSRQFLPLSANLACLLGKNYLGTENAVQF